MTASSRRTSVFESATTQNKRKKRNRCLPRARSSPLRDASGVGSTRPSTGSDSASTRTNSTSASANSEKRSELSKGSAGPFWPAPRQTKASGSWRPSTSDSSVVATGCRCYWRTHRLALHPKEVHAQLNFLKETMALDVTDGDACGAEVILEKWRLFSLYHSDVRVELKRLQLVSDESVLATTSTSITITDHTLRALYPHLMETEARGQFSLAGLLLNKRLSVEGSVRFDWDAASGRVVRLESKMDMVTPLLELLRTLDKVAAVFDSARITPEGRVVMSKQEGL